MSSIASPLPATRSAAVKIVHPNDEEPKQQTRNLKDTSQRPCRNVLIYGSCKFQDKGCIFYHPPTGQAQDTIPPSSAVSLSRTSTPSQATLSTQAVHAPVFVPKSAVTTTSSIQSASPPASTDRSNFTSPDPTYAWPTQYLDPEHNFDAYGYPLSDNGDALAQQMQGIDLYGAQPDMQLGAYASDYDQFGDINAYYPSSHVSFVRQPLQYHLYTPPVPQPFASKFISPDLREELTRRSETLRAYTLVPGLPEDVQGYHTMMLLENIAQERRKFGNWYSVMYRATHNGDGSTYALRRIENYRLVHQAAFNAIEAWSRIQHPNIVHVKEAFTTRAFNDNSLVVVYDYYPDARTLQEVHFPPNTVHKAPTSIPEATIWSYIVQLSSAIKAVHEAGLAVRILDTTKILVTSKNRVQIGSCGIVDVLTYVSGLSPDPAMPQYQQDDLISLGRLIFALATFAVPVPSAIPKALDTMSRLYSPDLKNIALWLIGGGTPGMPKNVGRLFELLGNRVVTEMDEANKAVDSLEGQLMSELENARLVRLLCKFGFINERPEFARDSRWSETGDRYIIKLFRDYVFHQVDETGNPVVNLSHVLTCLNKLDAGIDERVMLVSRDEQSCLVVSYKEIKSCVNSAFNELSQASYNNRQ